MKLKRLITLFVIGLFYVNTTASTNTAMSPIMSYLLSETSNPDRDGDGVLNEDDQWPDDASKPVLSTLWGAYGEAWDAAGRLPFVGMAGYRDGTTPLHVSRIVADVTDFGATAGVGTSDDTQAFTDAIAHAKTLVNADNHGVVYVPEGIYELNGTIHLDHSGLILKGAGNDKSEIHFVDHVDGVLQAITMGAILDENNVTHTGLNWQHNVWNSGFSTCLDNTNLPNRGDRILHLAQPMSATFKSNLAAQGNRIRIAQWMQRINGGSTPNLLEQIIGGPTMESGATGHTTLHQEFIATIIDDETMQMDRPLRWTPTNEAMWGQYACVSLRDTSAIWESEEIGVEDLKVWYEADVFVGHNGMAREGIQLQSSHSWVRNVIIENADNAIVNYPGTSHNTVTNVILDTQRSGSNYGPYPPKPYYYKIAGHIGIGAYGHDHLIENFDIRFSFIHDISMKNSQGSVFSNGKGIEINMDHHRQTIYGTLWTNIDLGVTHRMWDSTGDEEEGFQSDSLNTYWNIDSADPTIEGTAPVWPADGNWIRGAANWGYYTQNYVAVKGLDEKPQSGSYLDTQPYFDRDDIHLEAIDPEYVWPKNIYEAQKEAYQKGNLW